MNICRTRNDSVLYGWRILLDTVREEFNFVIHDSCRNLMIFSLEFENVRASNSFLIIISLQGELWGTVQTPTLYGGPMENNKWLSKSVCSHFFGELSSLTENSIRHNFLTVRSMCLIFWTNSTPNQLIQTKKSKIRYS